MNGFSREANYWHVAIGLQFFAAAGFSLSSGMARKLTGTFTSLLFRNNFVTRLLFLTCDLSTILTNYCLGTILVRTSIDGLKRRSHPPDLTTTVFHLRVTFERNYLEMQ